MFSGTKVSYYFSQNKSYKSTIWKRNMGQNVLSVNMIRKNSTLDNSYHILVSLTAEMGVKVE